MTVSDALKILVHLPPEMELVMLDEDCEPIPICAINSEIITTTDEDTGKEEDVFLFAPCFGHDDDEFEEPEEKVNIDINLN